MKRPLITFPRVFTGFCLVAATWSLGYLVYNLINGEWMNAASGVTSCLLWLGNLALMVRSMKAQAETDSMLASIEDNEKREAVWDSLHEGTVYDLTDGSGTHGLWKLCHKTWSFAKAGARASVILQSLLNGNVILVAIDHPDFLTLKPACPLNAGAKP